MILDQIEYRTRFNRVSEIRGQVGLVAAQPVGVPLPRADRPVADIDEPRDDDPEPLPPAAAAR